MNVPHQLKTFLDDVLLKAIGDIGDGVLILESHRIVYANEAFCKITGFSNDELSVLPSFFDLIPPANRASIEEKISAHFKNKKTSARYEITINRKNKKQAHLELTMNVIKEGSQSQMVSIARDITDQKTMMESLENHNFQYKLLFQSNPNPMWIYDLDSLAFLAVNDAAIQKYGFELKEFLSLTVKSIRDPSDVPVLIQKVNELKEGMNVLKERVRHRKKDGTLMDVEVMSHPIDFEGKKARFVMVSDISASKKAETALGESEKRLRAVVTAAPIVLFAIDRNGLFTLLEGSGLNGLNLKPGEVIGKSAFDLYRESPKIIQNLRRALAGESFFVVVEEQNLVFQTHYSPVLAEGGEVTGIIGTALDITDQKHSEQAFRGSEEKFGELFNNAIDSIFLFEINADGMPGKFIEVNDTACSKLCYSREELLRVTPLDIAAPEDLSEIPKMFKKLLQLGQVTSEKIYLSKTGLKIPVELNSHVIQWNGKQVVQSIARDITDRKRAEETIRRQAFYDVLTNLPNRTLFKDRLEQAMKHAHRNKQMLGIIVLDLDRFKNINETLGHLLGDKLLIAVAERLLGLLNESETIARFGGDEFTLLLPQVNSIEEATQHAQKIIEVLAAPFKLNNHELHVTTSIGIAFYPDDGENSEILLKNVETAMYRAKEQGRNNYQLYASIMNVSAFKQLLMENSLRRALEKGEFVVYYQPQVEIETNKIIGAEALIRWKHPDLGLVFPTEFIGLAEETGLIVPIGEWVIRKVCAQSKEWQVAGHPKICISVNLSARQFQQHNLVSTIARILQETGLDPQYLGMEITESIAMKNADFTISALNELKKMGIHLSLDDFGTGYSSLSYLKRFPLETLKIDRSFVRDITTDPNDAAIVTAVVALSHSLKLSVVAEGVETEGQLAFLKTQHCDHVQGYFYSHPLSEENFLKYLREH
ncbi:MAG TPA: EAL domain-containing protein [bacterium]